MLRSMKTDPKRRRPTEGHHLFEAWITTRYGAQARRPGRPKFIGIRAFVYDLNQIAKARPLGRPTTVYEWLGSALGPKVPRPVYRDAIAAISRGAVPAAAWTSAPEAEA